MSSTLSADTMYRALAEAGLSDLMSCPGDPTYEDITKDYWSRVAHKRPWCIVRPTTTEEVSKTLRAILAIPGCRFAVRGGGHGIWGAGAIDDGVLIDMSAMNATTYDPRAGLASIQAGARWGDVYEVLEARHGVTVGGGRESNVGVAGLTIGGGISWYSPRLGLVCDQVRNFEAVLADDDGCRIVRASAGENADLWRALKGGASNFAVVTRLDMETVPAIGPIWGGYRVCDKSTAAAQLEAFARFVDTNGSYPDSSCVLTWSYDAAESVAARDIVIAPFMVNTRGVENPPELKEVLAIPSVVEATKTTTVTQLMKEFHQPYGTFNCWYTATVKNDPSLLQEAVDLHSDVVEKLRSASRTGQFSTICLFQPVPAAFAAHGRARGGNSTGIDLLGEENAVLFCIGVHVAEPELQELGNALAAGLCAEFERRARGVGGLLPWIHGNHAHQSQNPFRDNGKNKDLLGQLRATAAKYDPSGVFQTRVPGGHKISQA